MLKMPALDFVYYLVDIWQTYSMQSIIVYYCLLKLHNTLALVSLLYK